VIESAEIAEHIEMANVQLLLDYNQLQMLEYQLKKLDGEVIQQEFGEQVSNQIKLPKQNLSALLLLFQ
jgi:putative IMPACT (imprinted ancient) family translation regulator